jgi:hypothetical protein
MSQSTTFEWQCHPEADSYVRGKCEEFLGAMPRVRALSEEILLRTGSSIFEWVDHLVLAEDEGTKRDLARLGFETVAVPADPGDTAYAHPGAILPAILLRRGAPGPGRVIGLAIHVENLSSFLMIHHADVPIEGSPLSPYRCARVWRGEEREFLVVERRSSPGYVPVVMPPDYPARYLSALERWATRPRFFADLREGLERTLQHARSLTEDMGTNDAAWIAFEAERAYWERRNRAGQVQKARQEAAGLGWANHDHHTFRSSRSAFPLLIGILETLGFRPRERFYASAEAGWGAQVMEQPACRLAVFADVDLSVEEISGDFTHSPLTPRHDLGTIGIWCALHGESMLSAGLHHLACRYEFDAVREGLSRWGVRMMHPFSDFPFLRQAFTEGERWGVSPEHLERLAANGQINEAQRETFASQGAVGSHLENIERRQGFKGFNQRNVSDIIRRTDPRLGLPRDFPAA